MDLARQRRGRGFWEGAKQRLRQHRPGSSTASMQLAARPADAPPTACDFFNPQPKDWSIKMNKKERRLALATALQSAAPDMVVVEAISSDGKVRRRQQQRCAPASNVNCLVQAEQPLAGIVPRCSCSRVSCGKVSAACCWQRRQAA